MKVRMGFVSNSSSEAFICRTSKGLRQIETELRVLLEFYNDFLDHNHKFIEVFDFPRHITPDDSKEFKDYNYRVGRNASIVIRSADDNSIPYSLFELIEEAFDADRIHLG